MIQLQNIEKFYAHGVGKTFILRRINAEIKEGEFVSIMGPSGAGKSTLLHLIGMHDSAWTGEYHFLDQPVHKLVHFQNMRILSLSAEGTYHRVFDVCIPKWLNQAGAKAEFVRLEDVGIHGNMHEMFLDRNSDEVIKFIDTWLRKNIATKATSGTR